MVLAPIGPAPLGEGDFAKGMVFAPMGPPPAAGRGAVARGAEGGAGGALGLGAVTPGGLGALTLGGVGGRGADGAEMEGGTGGPVTEGAEGGGGEGGANRTGTVAMAASGAAGAAVAGAGAVAPVGVVSSSRAEMGAVTSSIGLVPPAIGPLPEDRKGAVEPFGATGPVSSGRARRVIRTVSFFRGTVEVLVCGFWASGFVGAVSLISGIDVISES